MAEGAAPCRSSSAVNRRPSSARAPIIGSRFDDTRTAPTRSGSPPSPVRLTLDPIAAATSTKLALASLMSKYCDVENQSSAMPSPGERFQRMASRSGSLYGSGFNSSALATLKIAEFAPMPSASDSTAAAVRPGVARKKRTA